VVNVTKQNILDADDITHAELIELFDKQEKNNATTEEKYQIERYRYKKEWGIKLLDETKLAKCFRRTHILYNNLIGHWTISKSRHTNRWTKTYESN
jgi:hypothetical protein